MRWPTYKKCRIAIFLQSYYNYWLRKWWYLEFPNIALKLRFFFPGPFKRHSLLGKNVCLNFFQSGWWSADALGCHMIGICRGIGDSLKYHYKYWNKSCCRNESDQSYFCARMSTPNSLWRQLSQHCSGDKHLCDDDDERQTRGLLLFL